VSVPPDAVDLARAALRARRPGVTSLPILHDTLLDGPFRGDEQQPCPDRTVVFGDGATEVRVDVRYAEQGPDELTVRTAAGERVSVEALSPDPTVRLAETGLPPLVLHVRERGPLSLLVTSPGRTCGPWQTAWLVF
jgi:hypothetical protein